MFKVSCSCFDKICFNTNYDVLIPQSISKIRVRFLARSQVGKVVVDCHWSAVYSTERGHGDRVVTLSPPTSKAGVRSP